MRKTLFANNSRVEPTIFLMEKLLFSLKLFLAIFMGNPLLRLSEILEAVCWCNDTLMAIYATVCSK